MSSDGKHPPKHILYEPETLSLYIKDNSRAELWHLEEFPLPLKETKISYICMTIRSLSLQVQK